MLICTCFNSNELRYQVDFNELFLINNKSTILRVQCLYSVVVVHVFFANWLTKLKSAGTGPRTRTGYRKTIRRNPRTTCLFRTWRPRLRDRFVWFLPWAWVCWLFAGLFLNGLMQWDGVTCGRGLMFRCMVVPMHY